MSNGGLASGSLDILCSPLMLYKLNSSLTQKLRFAIIVFLGWDFFFLQYWRGVDISGSTHQPTLETEEVLLFGGYL